MFKKWLCTTITVLSLGLSTSLFVHAAEQNITVENGYIRETIPGTTISSAYMTINNKSHQNATLIGATSAVSPRIEIHEHSMVNGMMRMGKLESISIKALSSTYLQPSGLHLMVFDLPQPLKAETSVNVTLVFKQHPSITITLPVQGLKQSHSHH